MTVSDLEVVFMVCIWIQTFLLLIIVQLELEEKCLPIYFFFLILKNLKISSAPVRAEDKIFQRCFCCCCCFCWLKNNNNKNKRERERVSSFNQTLLILLYEAERKERRSFLCLSALLSLYPIPPPFSPEPWGLFLTILNQSNRLALPYRKWFS